MKFSKAFLNKLLKSAVSFHKNEQEGEEIPLKLNNIKTAILYFTNQLRFEANKAMQLEILSDSPLLHAVNLKTSNPGIVSDTSDKKLIIHREKKEKTPEQLLKEMEKKVEREKKQQEKKEKRKEEQEKVKEQREHLKKEKKEIEQMEKEHKKLERDIKKADTKKKKYEKKIQKNKATDDEIKEHDELESEINKYNKRKDNIDKELDSRVGDFEEKQSEYDEMVEEKKKIKEENKVKREAKKKENEEKRKKRKEAKEKKIAEEEQLYMEQLYNVVNEQDVDEEDEDPNKPTKVDPTQVVIHQSPLPFQRHLDSLEDVDPYEHLLPALLEGNPVTKDECSLTIFHGPPGTGKTYKLIETLSELLKNSKKSERFLVCAVSNIGTINLYKRAKSFSIKGSLVLSNPNLSGVSDEERLKWNPNTDKVVFTTISMRYGTVLDNQQFKTIMVDEAAQCQESWMWGLFRNEVRHIYLAGDPQQLPAVVSKEGIKYNYDRSLMTRLMSLNYQSTLLNVQRRMHPDIVKFPNEQFYEGQLKTQYDKKKNPHKSLEPFQIINVDGKEERVGTSYQNKEEANKCINLIESLKIKDTVVICPYQAQCKLLKNLLNEKNLKYQVHTIDSFQGREAECIILTTVRTGDKMGFWSDHRRLNVALTRAKHVLRIVGNKETWKKCNNPLSLIEKN